MDSIKTSKCKINKLLIGKGNTVNHFLYMESPKNVCTALGVSRVKLLKTKENLPKQKSFSKP